MKQNFAALTLSLFSLTTLASQHDAHKPYNRGNSWQFTLGAAAITSPIFTGSGNYGLSIFPNIQVAYGNKFFASFSRGVGYNFSNQRSWQYGPVAKYRFSRKEDGGDSPFRVIGNSDELKGLGNISGTVEAGGFISYSTRSMNYKVEARQALGGHKGLVGSFKVNNTGNLGGFRYSIGPTLDYANTDFVETYYGITAQQAINSGLPQYKASDGFTSVGVSGMLIKPMTEQVVLTIFANYKRLLGDVAKSPIVKNGSADQVTAGVGAGYTF